MTWFQLDGEPVQIAIYPSEQMFKKLEYEHQVKYGELPANHKKLFKFGMIRVQVALVNFMRLQMIIES